MYIFPGYVVYETEQDALVVSSKLLQNKVRISTPELREEFISMYGQGGCNDLSTPLSQFLHDQELLLEECDIIQTLENVKSFLMNRLLLTIMPTEACNFRCPYCYESHQSSTMPEEILRHIQNYIAHQAPYYNDISISWFGGEPTLCKDTILRISSQIQELQARHSFRYTASMTTNGYLLDVQSFIQYYTAGITSYQITLDGWNHDQTRPHVSGKGTLQTIVNNLIAISRLPKENYQYEIVLRRNLSGDDNDFSWYDFLLNHFGNDSRFSVSVFPVTNWGGESVKKLNLLQDNSRDDTLAAHNAYLVEHGLAVPTKENMLLSEVCYASCPNGYIFRADGRIEKCTIVLDHPKNLVGHVDLEKGVVIDKDANLQWSTSSLKPQCLTCPDVLSCLNISCKRRVVIDGCSESFCFHDKSSS